MKKSATAILWAATVFAFWASIFWMNGSLFAPLQGDEGDYLGRGINLMAQGTVAISDGFRPPLFVFISAVISRFFQGDLYAIAVRCINIAFVSIIPALWILVSKRSPVGKNVCVVMAVLTSIWQPFYYFSSMALAEAVSFFLLNVLVIITLDFSSSTATYVNAVKAGLCGVVSALLFLTKANAAIVAPACAIVAFLSLDRNAKTKIFLMLIAVLCFCTLAFPWLGLVHNGTGEWKLTTTGGLNFLIGTGRYFFGQKKSLEDAILPERYIKSKLPFKNVSNFPSAISSEDEEVLKDAKNSCEVDSISANLGRKIWRKDASIEAVYGLLKIAHGNGASLRNKLDLFEACFFISTLACTIYCLIRRTRTKVVLLHWLLFAGWAVVAFLYFPDIRFKTMHVDTTGLLLLSSTSVSVWESFISKRTRMIVA